MTYRIKISIITPGIPKEIANATEAAFTSKGEPENPQTAAAMQRAAIPARELRAMDLTGRFWAAHKRKKLSINTPAKIMEKTFNFYAPFSR